MKKRFLIGTTVLTMMLAVGILAYTVFAAISQGFFVKNNISFAGGQNIKFVIDGEITGTDNPDDENLKHTWEYDYETAQVNYDNWEVGNIVFDSAGKDVEDIHITYTFKITNQCEIEITASMVGPYNILVPFEANTFVQLGDQTAREGSSITVPVDGNATIILKLTLTELKDIHFDQDVDFSINVVPKEQPK